MCSDAQVEERLSPAPFVGKSSSLSKKRRHQKDTSNDDDRKKQKSSGLPPMSSSDREQTRNVLNSKDFSCNNNEEEYERKRNVEQNNFSCPVCGKIFNRTVSGDHVLIVSDHSTRSKETFL